MNRPTADLTSRVDLAAWPVQRKITASLLLPTLTEILIVLISSGLVEHALPGTLEASRIIALLLLLLALGLILNTALWLLLQASVVRPVEALYEAVRPDAPDAERASRDELAQLTSAVAILNEHNQQTVQVLGQRVAERTRDLEAARDIGQIMSGLHDVDSVANQVIALIQSRFDDIDQAQVFLRDEQSNEAVLRASTGDFGQQLLARLFRLPVEGPSLIGQAIRRAEPMIALDVAASFAARTDALRPDARAECVLPLRVGGDVLGALDVQSRSANTFSDTYIQLFQTIADQLAIAIQNARLFEQLQTRVREIEDLNRLLIGDAWRGYVQSRRRYRPVIATPGDENLSALQRQAITSGQLVEQFGTDTVQLAVPIALRGQVVGAVEWELARAAYTPNTRTLAVELVARLASSADNARLFEQTQRLAERERVINDIGTKISQQSSVSQILQVAVQELGRALQVAETSISLTKDEL